MAAPTEDLKFAESGDNNIEPTENMRNAGWDVGQKPPVQIFNWLMNGYWQNFVVGDYATIAQTVDGVTISVLKRPNTASQNVRGVIEIDTELQNNKSLVFGDLPAPLKSNTLIFKDDKFEANFSAGKRLNLIRRGGWDREFAAVGDMQGGRVYNGEVFVLDTAGNNVNIYDLNGNFKRSFATGGLSTDGLGFTVYNDEVFITHKTTNFMYVFDLFGNSLRNFDIGATGTIYGISVYKDLIYYAVDVEHKVYVTELDGTAVTDFSSVGSLPFGIDVYNNEVFVFDWTTKRVYVFNLTGTAQRDFLPSGAATSGGITVYNDEIFCADWGADLIIVSELDGTFKRKFTIPSTAPAAISIFNDEIYLVDDGTTSVYIKSIFSDDSVPAEAYTIKKKVPFSYKA